MKMQSRRPAKSSWVVPSFSVNDNDGLKHAKKRQRPAPSTISQLSKKDGKTLSALETYLWVEKHSPTTQDELAVHKKKAEEVKSFLQSCFKSKSPNRILLLTGPAGAGKTATVQALSKDEKFEVVEWLNKTGVSQLYGNDIFDESQVVTFREFLLKSNRYSSNQLFGQPLVRSKRIILIKEFPTAFFKDKSQFHDVIRQYRKIGTCPLIFIISDNTKDDSNESSLLPAAFKAEVEITAISFNPIAPMSMTKALTRIANAEGVVLGASTLNHLADGASGDIRAAINALQFQYHKDAKGVAIKPGKLDQASRSRQPKNTIKKDVKVDEGPSPFAIRDQSLYLFHALGKILHCKRNYGTAIVNSLPVELRNHERCPLLVDPEDVWERTSATANRFVEFLHQNYLSFFTKLEDVTRASNYLSQADMLTSEWEGRLSLDPFISSIASRGIMHCNSKETSSGWRPITKPKIFEINKKFEENTKLGKQLFQEQTHFLQNVTKINSRKLLSRCNTENLSEKDTLGDCNVDVDNNPLLPSRQVKSAFITSDEDIIIEDYDD